MSGLRPGDQPTDPKWQFLKTAINAGVGKKDPDSGMPKGQPINRRDRFPYRRGGETLLAYKPPAEYQKQEILAQNLFQNAIPSFVRNEQGERIFSNEFINPMADIKRLISIATESQNEEDRLRALKELRHNYFGNHTYFGAVTDLDRKRAIEIAKAANTGLQKFAAELGYQLPEVESEEHLIARLENEFGDQGEKVFILAAGPGRIEGLSLDKEKFFELRGVK